MTKQSFLKGALILVLASGLVKLIGFTYQIMVIRIIGTEGIGVFNMVFPLYITCLVLTTMGLPLAVSKLVAEETSQNNHDKARQIFGMTITLLLFIATFGALVLIFASPRLVKYFFADPRVTPALLVLAPCLLLVAISSAFRGYFQGIQDMRPTAFTQLVEQLVRFVSGLLLVYLLHPYGFTWSAVGLAGGILLSEIAGLIYIWRRYTAIGLPDKIMVWPTFAVTKKLFNFGIPITTTRIISSLVLASEASLIPQQLIKAGKTISQATSFYGELSGVVFTLMTIPSILTYSLATTLVPAIAEAQSQGYKQVLSQRTRDAIGITLLAGLPSALILFFWGPYLSLLLFKVNQAGPLLKLMSLACVFLYLAQTTSGILQGMGHVKTYFAITLIGGSLRLSGIFFLGADPNGGINNIALSYMLSYVAVALLNLYIIKKKTNYDLGALSQFRLLLVSFFFGLLLYYSTPLIMDSILTLVVLTITYFLLFLFLLYCLGDKYVALIFRQLFQVIRRQ